MMVMRMVARAAYQGKQEAFDSWWKVEHAEVIEKTWGSKEDAAELRKQIEKAHGIKLS